MAADKDDLSAGNLTLNDVMGTDKPSEKAGSGKTQKINLDDIDLDEDIDISGATDNPTEEAADDNNMDLEFGDGTGEMDLPVEDITEAAPAKTKEQHNEMPIPSPDDDNSNNIDLDMSDSADEEIEEIEDVEEEDESYEAAPDNAGDIDLSGEELYEQSQSSIKTGGAASKKLKSPAVKKETVKPPEKNAQPRKATVEHNANCNFCKIALRRFKLMTIYEDDQVIAIMDPKPLMKGQVLLCSKTHKSDISDLTSSENAHFFNVAKMISDGLKNSKIPADGVSYFLSESVNEQQDMKHVYMSLIPRKPKDGIGLKFSKKNSASTDDLELLGDHLIQFIV